MLKAARFPLFLVILFSLEFVFAKTTVSTKLSHVQKTVEKYSKASSLQFEIKKTDEKKVLGTKTQATGLIKIFKNKIFISQNGDKKIEMFYANHILSLVEYPDSDFGKNEKRKVTILKKNTPPLVKSVLNIFTNPKDFNKDFTLVSQKENQGIVEIILKPSQKMIKDLNLKIDAKSHQLKELSFVDDVETTTRIEFSNEKQNLKMDRKDFEFTSLKSDEVFVE